MISNTQLVAKLRELGFSLEDQTKRVFIYRKKGTPIRVTFNKRDFHSELGAGNVLSQAKMDKTVVRAWIAGVEAQNKEQKKP